MDAAQADVTAIVLNYARLENVKVIVTHLCSQLLRGVILSVVVWNNNTDITLSISDFASANAPNGMIKIVNSSENLYFQARFLACVDAPTDWCLVQDDDYLVSAEAIRAVRNYILINQTAKNEYPIHLLPPHEHLLTTIRTRVTENAVASFAWLGHGTFLTKTHARSFLDLLRTLSDNRDDIMKMADNFFSILLNRRAETWIDPGKPFETGKEQAFTVGVEGDERNWRYIKFAEEYLERIASRSVSRIENQFSTLPGVLACDVDIISRAPVLTPGYVGVWSSNISMIQPEVMEAGSSGNDLRTVDKLRRNAMSNTTTELYIRNSLACIGDGLPSTVFRSPAGCQEGQWIQFDFLDHQPVSTITFRWTVEPEFASEIRQMSYDILEKDRDWTRHDSTGIEAANQSTITIRLALERPSFLVSARATVGAGSHKRPPWAVVACVVEGA